MATALVGLGGNTGDVLATFRAALSGLGSLPGTRLARTSRAYRTRALMADPRTPPGPDYWNAAIVLETELSPHQLLSHLQAVERAAGRVRRTRWEARPLDLDLLFYDDRVIDDAELTVPHPHVLSRIFVLAPLADLVPDRRIDGRTVQERVRDFDAGELLEILDSWA